MNIEQQQLAKIIDYIDNLPELDYDPGDALLTIRSMASRPQWIPKENEGPVKRGIIIIGPQASGKTLKAKEIASHLKVGEVLHVSPNNLFELSTNGINRNTKLIVIEEVNSTNINKVLKLAMADQIKVDFEYQRFTIYPQFILVIQPEEKELDLQSVESKLLQRFYIIRMKEQN